MSSRISSGMAFSFRYFLLTAREHTLDLAPCQAKQSHFFSSAKSVVMLFLPIMKLTYGLFVLLVMAGCTNSATVSPGMTFLAGLNNYQTEMDRLGGNLERWPDRQRLAQSIKTTYLATLGGSKEFNRLVDLDLKRREFLITMQNQTLDPRREQEMKKELVQIDDQLDGLKKVIKGQIARAEVREPSQAQKIETIATIGLIDLAIDFFAV